MMRRENGRVLIDISEDEYFSLLLTMGFAIGASQSNGGNAKPIIVLANAINEGNPLWTPYQVPE